MLTRVQEILRAGKYRARKAAALARALLVGKGNFGYCPVCDKPSAFLAEGAWLRDHYRCIRCWSIPRQRALIRTLNEFCPEWRSMAIHESSPCGSASDKLRTECRGYTASQFFADQSRGSIYKGFRCEDLASQTFADETFDIVITADVLEHLLEPEAAICEIARTLRPGGAHVFTVPWYYWQPTRARAVRSGEGIRFIEPATYHGNPIDDKGTLVVTDWGYELPFLIQAWSGLSTMVVRTIDRSMGLDGKFIEVFVSRKPGSQAACLPLSN